MSPDDGEVRLPECAHPDVVQLVRRFEAANVAPYEEMSVGEARAALEEVTRLQGPPLHVAEVRNIEIAGAAGSLKARLYNPSPGETLPIVVYLHGGGWALGSIAAADRPCRRLCNAGNCIVVSIEYRLAPETKFPGPLQDCVQAVRWVASNARDLGGRPQSLILMGDSAGGNLAAATSLVLRDKGGPAVAHQILLYPALYPSADSPFDSYRENADSPLLGRATMDWFWGHYLPSPADGDNPLAAPLRSLDVSGLPAATIIVAELDPLRDEGLAYAERLGDAGVPVVTTLYPGAAHGFWWMDAALSQAADLDEQLGKVIFGLGKD